MKSKNILYDWKHWAGWLLSTGAIIGVSHLMGVHLHRLWYQPIVILSTIVLVDYIKHKLKLQ